MSFINEQTIEHVIADALKKLKMEFYNDRVALCARCVANNRNYSEFDSYVTATVELYELSRSSHDSLDNLIGRI